MKASEEERELEPHPEHCHPRLRGKVFRCSSTQGQAAACTSQPSAGQWTNEGSSSPCTRPLPWHTERNLKLSHTYYFIPLKPPLRVSAGPSALLAELSPRGRGRRGTRWGARPPSWQGRGLGAGRHLPAALGSGLPAHPVPPAVTGTPRAGSSSAAGLRPLPAPAALPARKPSVRHPHRRGRAPLAPQPPEATALWLPRAEGSRGPPHF